MSQSDEYKNEDRAYLKLDEPVFKLILGHILRLIDVKAPVDEIGYSVLAAGRDVAEGWVVVDEGSAGEADAVKVEDDVDRIDAARLVSDLHPTQDDLEQKPCQAVFGLGVPEEKSCFNT